MTGSVRRIASGFALLVATAIVGVIGYLAAGWSLLDAVYMVVITIFGVGYGEVQTMGAGLRLFTIGLILVGCSSLIYILGGVFQMITEGEINRALGRRKMKKNIDELSGHCIVCGFGRMGRELAEALRDAGRDCVIVDSDPARQQDAMERAFHVVPGDATHDDTLREAGIARASTLASVLSQDALNVFITLSARNLNSKLLIVARGEERATEQKLRHAGANHVVMPTAIGAERLAQIVARPGVLEFFAQANLAAIGQDLASIGVQLEEFEVSRALVGRTVGAIESCGRGGFMVIAVKRAGGSIIRNPDQSFTLAEEDRILLLGHHENMPDLERMFAVHLTPMVYRGAVIRR